jgi:hypothetical protein
MMDILGLPKKKTRINKLVWGYLMEVTPKEESYRDNISEYFCGGERERPWNNTPSFLRLL